MKPRTILGPARQWRTTCATIGLAVAAFCATSTQAQINWISTDVGAPTFKGSVVNDGNGVFTINGGGADIWGTGSQFHYYYAWAYGQTWDAVVQVQSLVGPDEWSKCELMADWADPIAGPQGDDAFIAAMATQSSSYAAPDGGNGWNGYGVDQFRVLRGSSADQQLSGTTGVPSYPNVWMKLHRNGNVFSVQYGPDGVTWTDFIEYRYLQRLLLGDQQRHLVRNPVPGSGDRGYCRYRAQRHLPGKRRGGRRRCHHCQP